MWSDFWAKLSVCPNLQVYSSSSFCINSACKTRSPNSRARIIWVLKGPDPQPWPEHFPTSPPSPSSSYLCGTGLPWIVKQRNLLASQSLWSRAWASWLTSFALRHSIGASRNSFPGKCLNPTISASGAALLRPTRQVIRARPLWIAASSWGIDRSFVALLDNVVVCSALVRANKHWLSLSLLFFLWTLPIHCLF